MAANVLCPLEPETVTVPAESSVVITVLGERHLPRLTLPVLTKT